MVMVNIPQVAADIGVAHGAEQLHIALNLGNVPWQFLAGLEVNHDHLPVIVDNAVGACVADVAFIVVEIEDAALIEYFPAW